MSSDHGIWEDGRSETGFTFYCPRQDWRYAVRVGDDDFSEDIFNHCPGCGREMLVANIRVRREIAP